MTKLSQALADQVAADQQPRQATADDGSVHMLFWDAPRVRSCLLADWPTVQAELATHEAERTQAAQLRQQIIQSAQSAVGIALGALTAQQRNSLIALLLWKAGALNRDGTVKALEEWVR